MNWLNGLGLQLSVPNNLSSSNDIIIQKDTKVKLPLSDRLTGDDLLNAKYSISDIDNEGRKLSPEQKERYKNVSDAVLDSNEYIDY